MDNPQQEKAIKKIVEERKKQDKKWGEQNHHPIYWLGILTEELGEVSKEIIDHPKGDIRGEEYEEELIQLAAVAVAALECWYRHKDKKQEPIEGVYDWRQ